MMKECAFLNLCLQLPFSGVACQVQSGPDPGLLGETQVCILEIKHAASLEVLYYIRNPFKTTKQIFSLKGVYPLMRKVIISLLQLLSNLHFLPLHSL